MTLGQVIEGRYRIGDKIAVGGMSTVYMGRDMQTGQAVAIKVMDEKLTDDPDYLARFEREAQVGVSLSHPGIPKVFAYGKEDDRHFLVLEYVQGITLTEYLRKKGPLPIEEAVAIASSVLTILSYAYSKGIQAHRDIKPGNIMIDLRTHAVTVMDFGIAKTVGSSLTHSTVLYTPRYAAPEQLLPSKFGGVVDKRADLYALGVVLYEMLTGRVPFTGETPAEISGEQITSPPPSPSSIRRDIPAPLSQVLLTCLQANPSHRYQTPQDLLQDLREGRPSPTRETTETLIRKEPPVVPVDQPRPRPRLPLLVPLLALALVILIPLTIMLVRGAKSEPPVAVTATLTVTSTPPGAEVSLNGTSSGTTPLTKTVPPGTYIVLLTLSGYEDYRGSTTLDTGGTRTERIVLTRKPASSTTPNGTEDSERILSFDSAVTVREDSTLLVQETIRVVSQGLTIQHGIYRVFPTTSTDPSSGRAALLSVKVVDVKRDGAREPWHASVTSDGVDIYFGSSSTDLVAGEHTYVFTYETNPQIALFDTHEELYWNVTGYWGFRIERASCTVVLPESAWRQISRVTAYSGPQGAVDTDVVLSTDADGNPVFSTTGALNAGEGLSVVVEWAKSFGMLPSTIVDTDKTEQGPGDALPTADALRQAAKPAILNNADIVILETYVGTKAGVIVGAVARVRGKGYDGQTTAFVGVYLDSTIASVIVLETTDSLGSTTLSPAFAAQFVDKKASDPLSIGSGINAVSGATFSSASVSALVKATAQALATALAGGGL